MTTAVVKVSIFEEISYLNAVVLRNILRSFPRENLFSKNDTLLRRCGKPIETSLDCWSSRRLSNFRWRVHQPYTTAPVYAQDTLLLLISVRG